MGFATWGVMLLTFKKLSLLAARTARFWAGRVWLTPSRLELMLAIYEEPLIQRDIAFALGVTRSVVSKQVTVLEKLGMVRRKGIEGDKRLRLITLTDYGIGMLAKFFDMESGAEWELSNDHAADLELLHRFEDKLGGNVPVTALRQFLERDYQDAPRAMAAALFVEPTEGRSRSEPVHGTPVWCWKPLDHVTEKRLRGPLSDLHRDSGLRLRPPKSKWVPMPPRLHGARVTHTEMPGP